MLWSFLSCAETACREAGSCSGLRNAQSSGKATVAVGVSKLKLQEMGSRYLFIVLYVFLEHHLSRGDYRRAGSGERRLRPGLRGPARNRGQAG